jgi:hypothetical protein
MNFNRPAASMRATPGRSASRAFLPSVPYAPLLPLVTDRHVDAFTLAGTHVEAEIGAQVQHRLAAVPRSATLQRRRCE